MIDELNSIAEYFLDDDGSSLSFRICKGTDQTFLWKLTIRIECSKSIAGEDESKCERILRLNQFVNIYNHIKLQSEVLKSFQTNETAATSSKLTDSRLYDTIQSLSIDESSSCFPKDDEVCCICMEAKPNLILSCTHNYCEKCIQEWQVNSDTCPICRCYAGKNDGFVLADYRPNYYNLQDELSKSLFKITQDTKSNTKRNEITDEDSD